MGYIWVTKIRFFLETKSASKNERNRLLIVLLQI
jgi:hypothetical protein